MIELIYDIRTYSENDWILNYTNRPEIVAEVFNRENSYDKNILNISDMPIKIIHSYETMIDKEECKHVPEYFGLNHFGWFTKIYDKQGNDLTQKIKNKILNEGFLPQDKEIANDES